MSEANGKPLDRKIICLGMPSGGELTHGAATGFYRASKRPEHDLRLLPFWSSLPTQNMNVVWCWFLNTNRKTPIAYAAMQHTDIEPEEFWLDKAIDELEAKDLDVLGVVSPIKDQRGRTSTALGKLDGDTWRIHARLTVREIHKLPETFTSDDLGYPLLINTGLFVCKFHEEWARKIFFTVNDRIMVDPKAGDYFPQVEPEDWFVSRLFHELNLRVGCTRKIALEHRGNMLFTNRQPWGDEFDKEYVESSVLISASHFPDDITGWLTSDEGRELARIAAGKIVLEIGSYCGRSTVCLAQAAKSVCAIDTFDGRGTPTPADTYRTFNDNLQRYGVSHKVGVRRGIASEMVRSLPATFDLAFIDGAHDYESVKSDIRSALSVLKPGGLLAFHDYRTSPGDGDPDVRRAVDEFIADGAELLGRVGSLAVVRPVAAAALLEA